MAKQNVGFGERHLEKLVIGVAGAVLLAILFLYVIQDPYKVAISGETLGPGAFYNKLDEQVTRVVQQLKSAEPPAAKPWDAPKLPANKSTDLPTVYTMLNPPVPQIDTGIQIGNKLDLVGILPPGKPVGTTGRANCALARADLKILGEPQPPADTEQPTAQDQHWVALFATLNRRAQQEAFIQAKYAVDRQLLIVTRVEAERQRLLSDGTWEEPAQPVELRHVAHGYSGKPTVELQEGPAIANEDYTYMAELRASASKEQALILRPDFQKALDSNDAAEWKVPAQMPSGVVYNWVQDYSLVIPAATTTDKPTGAEDKGGTRVDYRKIKTQVQELEKKGDLAEAVRVLSAAVSPKTLVAKDQTDAEAWLAQLEVKAQKAAEKATAESAARQANVEANLGPEMDLIWLTDTTAKPSETYRYRLRVLAVNPHAGLIPVMRKPEDAAKVILAGEWSEWSDPIALPPSQYLFITKVDAPNQNVNIELYNWTNGEWKKGSATLGVGQTVQFTDKYQEFSYDAVIASLDPAREYEERSADAKKGVRYRDAKATEAVTLLTASGEAQEHLVARDMDLRRDLNAELNKKKEAQPKTGVVRPEDQPTRRRGRAGQEDEMPTRRRPM